MAAPFTSFWISQTLGLPAPVNADFSAFSTDSRTVKPGEFFVALKGDKFDGHDFLTQVAERGVKGILCRKGTVPAGYGGYAAEVDDTIDAFRTLAGAWRQKLDIPVVAIAGAVGKTTTKEFLASLLRGKWPDVLSTAGSFNGFIGIPITLMNLRSHHRAAVIEIGIDDIGAMAQHLEVVKPNAVVVTAIAEEHLENLKDLATVAREELLGMAWADERGGSPVFHLDDPWIEAHFKTRTWKNATTVSLTGKRGGQAKRAVVATVEGDLLHLTAAGNDFPLPLPLPGAHNAHNLAMAVAVALALGVTSEQMQRGISTFTPPKGRSEVHHLANGVTVLADYYNASPASMRASLDLFRQLCAARDGKRWLFLGDMLELGTDELALHEGLWPDVKKTEPTEVVLFGPRMKSLAQKLRNETKLAVSHFESMDELLAAKAGAVAPGDTVVVKGSRGMKMERIWENLKQRV